MCYDDDNEEDAPAPDTGEDEDIPEPEVGDDEYMPVPDAGGEEDIPVPNTGAFTNEGSSAKMINNFVAITVVIGAVVATSILIKKVKRG